MSDKNNLPNDLAAPRRRGSIFDWFTGATAGAGAGSTTTTTTTTQSNSIGAVLNSHRRANSYSCPETNQRPSISMLREELSKSGSNDPFEDDLASPISPRLSTTSTFPLKPKPRSLSQSGITHDEALNLARAGISRTPPNAGDVKPELRKVVPKARRTSKAGPSTYEGLGLVAAYSGGPSSF